MLTDSKNFVIVGFCNKFAARYCYISHRTLRVLLSFTTLPCETSAADTFDFQQVIDDVRGVFKFGETNLTFIDPGVKINGTHCRDVLLTEHLQPVLSCVSSDGQLTKIF